MKNVIRMPSYDLGERPFMIIWETTRSCDLACRHCRAEAIPTHHPLMLTTDEGKAFLDQVAELGSPRPILVLTGGDPFKREDLFELLEYGNKRNLVMAVSPSGTPLLTPERLQRIKSSGAKAVSLSIDGSNPDIHDSFRGVPGSFERTKNGWDAANEAGLKVQINTTVTRHNLEDLPLIFELIVSRKIMTWSIFFLVPTGRGKREDQVSPSEYEALMHFLYDCSKYVGIKTTEGHHYKRIVLQRTIFEEKSDTSYRESLNPIYSRLHAGMENVIQKHDLVARDRSHRSPLHINAGRGFVFVSHIGEVQPSGFLPITVGNVRTESLSKLYQDSPLFRSLRDENALKGICGECEFREICGGSRSRAYALTGDPLAEERTCAYIPGSFQYQNELQAILQTG